MHTLLLFIVYLGLVLLLASLLYYPVFQALDAIWEIRPDRVYYRLAMILAVLGFWPFLRLLGINDRYALGYSLDSRHFLQAFFRGLGLGVLIMALHALLLILLGARVLKPEAIPFSDLFYVLITGLVSGFLVAVIEESFFRGALQYGMRRSSPVMTTFIMTNLLYASLHFIHPPTPPEDTMITWGSGWQMLAGIFHQYGNFSGFLDSYLSLFTAGLLLSLVRERTGNIALCMGIHAGWVLTIKITWEATRADIDSPAAFVIGSYDNITGWAATVVLGLAAIWIWRYYRRT